METPNATILCKQFTSVLSKRVRPPHSIKRNTIYYWIKRSYDPDWLMIEYILQHADSDYIRDNVDHLVNYLDSNLPE